MKDWMDAGFDIDPDAVPEVLISEASRHVHRNPATAQALAILAVAKMIHGGFEGLLGYLGNPREGR